MNGQPQDTQYLMLIAVVPPEAEDTQLRLEEAVKAIDAELTPALDAQENDLIGSLRIAWLLSVDNG